MIALSLFPLYMYICVYVRIEFILRASFDGMVLQGRTFREIGVVMKETYFPTVKAGWRIWPAAQLLNQTMVPIHFRTVSMDIVGFFWDMYLTMMVTGGSSKEPEVVTEGEDGEADEGAGRTTSPRRGGGEAETL